MYKLIIKYSCCLVMVLNTNGLFAQRNFDIKQAYIQIKIKCPKSKSLNKLTIHIKNTFNDTLLVTNALNCWRCMYIDSLSGDADHVKYYKTFLDNHLAGIEQIGSPFQTLAPKKSVRACFKYQTQNKLTFTLRVFSVKQNQGLKIIIALHPNKYISYQNESDYYSIEKVETIYSKWE